MSYSKPAFVVTSLLSAGIALTLSFSSGESQPLSGSAPQELRLIPNGINPSPNWGLEKIGEIQDDGPAYTYPDTANPVRLYLIDTAVANPGDWIGENPNIEFEETVVIRGRSDPEFSTEFDHGTRMLSIIAGLRTGVAPGTPIKVLNYDVYPGRQTTTVIDLTEALWDAVAHYQDSVPQIPSVICLASSSDMLGSSQLLRSAVQFAIDEGITVVISAGNSGAEAANYIPAAYGNTQGVICVGASNQADQPIDISNHGAPVDLLAPGDMILAKDEISADSYVLMRGTSPAAALVAGSALAELSINGSLTPAEVEAKLIAAAVPSPTPGAPPVLRATSAAAAHIALPDGAITDPALQLALTPGSFPDLDASDPDGGSGQAPDSQPGQTHIDALQGSSPSSGNLISLSSNNEIEFTFPIDLSVVDPDNLFALRNGYSWRIRCSEDLITWHSPQGRLDKRTAPDGTVLITATIPKTADACFLRLEVAPTPAP